MTKRRPQPVDGGVTLRSGEQLVYMIVDVDTAMPVGGPYVDVEHSRDAWHFLVAPGVKLSHLQLIVRDRQDLVEQVRTWRDGFLRERQERGRCCG